MPNGLSFLVPAGALSGPLFAAMLKGNTESAPALPAATRLGPFALIRELGRGGHGVVYLAQRADGAFEQTVAIKVLHAEHRLRKRFLRERESLGRLRHPGIAHIIDGGESADGVLWCAMEFIEGTRIDRYVIDRGCDLKARIAIFVAICRAVEHAHQNLVVHGDITPGNILVEEGGVPRLLDFGISRHLDSTSASEEDLSFTPGFASPEQMHGTPLGTGSDVYQLGGLLRRLFWADMSRDARRTSETDELRIPRLAQKNILTICEKAGAADPDSRYGSVAELRAELQRVLDSRPAMTRRWSWSERAGFALARRSRSIALGLLVAAMLTLVVGYYTMQLTRQRDLAQREASRAQQVSEFLADLFHVNNPEENRGDHLSASELLERGAARIDLDLRSQPLMQANLLQVIGEVYINLGALDKAGPMLQRALQLRRSELGSHAAEVAETLQAQAVLLDRQAHYTEALALSDQALSILDGAPERVSQRVNLYNKRGLINKHLGHLDRALDAFESALKLTAERADLQELAGRVLNNRGLVEMSMKNYVAARRSFEQAMATYVASVGETHPLWMGSAANLGWALTELQQLPEAEQLLQRSARATMRLYGENSAEYADQLNTLGGLLVAEHKTDQALRTFKRSASVWRNALGPDHPATTHPLHNLGNLYRELGQPAVGLTYLQQVLELRERRLGATHMDTTEAQVDIGKTLLALQRRDEAIAAFDTALVHLRAASPPVPAVITGTLALREEAALASKHSPPADSNQSATAARPRMSAESPAESPARSLSAGPVRQ